MAYILDRNTYREQAFNKGTVTNAKLNSQKRMITQLYDAMIKSKIGPNEWEQKFINSVYQQVKLDKRLSDSQDAMLTKLFEKY